MIDVRWQDTAQTILVLDYQRNYSALTPTPLPNVPLALGEGLNHAMRSPPLPAKLWERGI
jgi:hypothetical protein